MSIQILTILSRDEKNLKKPKLAVDSVTKRPAWATTMLGPRVLPNLPAFVNPPNPIFLEIITARKKPTALRRWASFLFFELSD